MTTALLFRICFWQGYDLLNLVASWLRAPWDRNQIQALRLIIDGEEVFLNRSPDPGHSEYEVLIRTLGVPGPGACAQSLVFSGFHADPHLLEKLGDGYKDRVYTSIKFGHKGIPSLFAALCASRLSSISAELQYEILIRQTTKPGGKDGYREPDNPSWWPGASPDGL